MLGEACDALLPLWASPCIPWDLFGAVRVYGRTELASAPPRSGDQDQYQPEQKAGRQGVVVETIPGEEFW